MQIKLKNAIYVLIIIILAALQTTILSGVRVFGASADLLLAFVVYIALSDGAIMGGSYGLLCGLIADALSVGRFGFNSFMFLYAGVLPGIFKEHFFHNNIFVAMLCSFFACLVHKFFYFILFNYMWNGIGFWNTFFTKILIGALLTSLITALFYLVNSYIENNKERKGIRRRYGF